MTIQYPLSWILILPSAALLFLFLTPPQKTQLLRRISLLGTLLPLLLSAWVFASYNHSTGGFQWVEKMSWVDAFGISYHLGVDGINSVLILLLGFSSFCGALISKSIKDRVKEFYILLMLMVIGTYGAFLSLDIFFFYFFHEIAAIPTFLMISIWGSGHKDYGAMKLTLYLTAGASIALIGLIALYCTTGLNSFNFIELQQYLASNPLPTEVQHWIFPLIVLGFGIALTLWPFYTWAPVGYATAPTAVSMLHAGVLKKLAAYAILRFAIQLMPQAAAVWMPIVAVLGVINILYCGFVALTQRDLKYLLGYSSCSHMGYIFLGLACMDVIGLNGVVILMFAHGILASLGFALTGFIADQTQTRNLDELGGIAKRMPFIGTCFAMMALASAGVPGFANFVAEILVLIGSWDQYRWPTVLAILGIVISAVYMLKTIRVGFQGPLNTRWSKLNDAQTISEKLPFVLLLMALIAVGCWPSLILKHIDSGVKPIAQHIQLSINP